MEKKGEDLFSGVVNAGIRWRRLESRRKEADQGSAADEGVRPTIITRECRNSRRRLEWRPYSSPRCLATWEVPGASKVMGSFNLHYLGRGIVFLTVSVIAARAGDLARAEDLYKHTEFAASLALLDKHSTDAATNFLIGRDYFMLVDFKKAAEHLQLAVAEEPTNPDYLDWLGRAYGKRAETGNPLLAPGLASKARVAFERAVELDPKNGDALSDLFDYYLDAPGFLGGGYDRAMSVAERTTSFDPAQGYFEKAKLAQKRKEFQAAEDHLRRAINIAPKEVGHVIALARFLATQGRNKESDAVFLDAQTKNPNAPQVWFAWASVLVKEKRDLGQARKMLENYMQASITPDDPPKQEARRLLKEVGGA